MIDTTPLIEIRWYGRGGQGAVTSVGLVAEAAIRLSTYGTEVDSTEMINEENCS